MVNDKMRDSIRQAIAELEKTTSGEMVCVLVPASARYVMFPLFWAALIALISPVLNGFGQTQIITFTIQSFIFIALAGLFTLTPIKICLTPHEIVVNNCRCSAFEQFFLQKMHDTSKRTGLMLYVSVEEHYVDLIADKGINDKVKQEEWDGIIQSLITDIRAQKIEEGFLKTITSCKEILARYFPETRGEVNELSDHLVEIKQASLVS